MKINDMMPISITEFNLVEVERADPESEDFAIALVPNAERLTHPELLAEAERLDKEAAA